LQKALLIALLKECYKNQKKISHTYGSKVKMKYKEMFLLLKILAIL